MVVYLVVARDIDKQTHVLYYEEFAVYYTASKAEEAAKNLRTIYNQVDIYENEVR